MRPCNLTKAAMASFALLLSVSATAEWWTPGYNGTATFFIDVESIRVVESVSKTKAWTAVVPESTSPKPATPKKGKAAPSDPMANASLRMLIYVDCSEWTMKQVQQIAVDKKTSKILFTAPAASTLYGFEDIDTATMFDAYAKIMCADDPREKMRELKWWPTDTESYLEYSARLIRIQNWISKANELNKNGKSAGEPPAEVVDFLFKAMLREAPVPGEAPQAPDNP